jgi:hypothetical protein
MQEQVFSVLKHWHLNRPSMLVQLQRSSLSFFQMKKQSACCIVLGLEVVVAAYSVLEMVLEPLEGPQPNSWLSRQNYDWKRPAGVSLP